MKVAGLLVAALFLISGVACGGDSDPAASSPVAGSATARPSTTRSAAGVATATPGSTREAPVATATATTAPEPSPTPEPPTATAEPPTATPEPPTATPEPPTATPVPPTPPPPPPPTATPPSAPGPQSLFVTAQGLKFSPETLVVPSGSSVTITLSNQDNIVPHNISVSGLGTSATCPGPCTATLSFTAPTPGNYPFLCTVHPFMTGTLVVQ